MTIPSEFTLLHYGQEIVMIPHCILHLVTNLVISYMVFVSDIQKPWIASLFILLSSSAGRVQLSHAYGKVDKMSFCISLALEAREMFLSLHIGFSLKVAAVDWAILESISILVPSLEMADPRCLKFFISSSL